MLSHVSSPRLACLTTSLALIAMAVALPAPAEAQANWGGQGRGGGWGEPGWGGASHAPVVASNEGRVEVDRFLADGAGPALGHGAVAVIAAPGGTADARDEATYEAAVIDQLAKAGYDTATPNPTGGQITEITVTRDVAVPEEPKRNPVSGEMSVGVSNRGSMMGLGVNVDLTKPTKALSATRLALVIRDRASGKALWEGRASVTTRDEDPHWTQQAIATRLAASLFEHFPAGSAVAVR